MTTPQSLTDILTCYATPSAGMHPCHTLPLKLRAIRDAGFTLVEIAMFDIEGFAAQEHPGYKKMDEGGQGDIETLITVARKVNEICSELGLTILAVHPFEKFEGYKDAGRREDSFERAFTYFKVLKELNCQMMQIGSSDDPSSSPDLDIIARDLRQLADEANAQDPPIRLAYELWAWGAHVNTWEGTWEVCKRVNRPNFGLCLDTWQICARTYMNPDPSKDGSDLFSVSAGAPVVPAMTESLRNLTETFAAPKYREKIFYFQISDGSGPGRVNPAELLQQSKEQGIPPLYQCSTSWRPLPFMDDIYPGSNYGGFLPVLDVIEAVIRTGWRGPWSYEVFYQADMGKDDQEVPKKWTTAAMKSHEHILKALAPLHSANGAQD
ncbi:hypothetical protein HYDPIDRAFT_90751 [Hydnomerulius pinastri MD-312]|uniref:Xylose isomerase-like TIM barrel domain-containing protein n=1 Tax=Hydnomerulius pinastri MD-312 TaxID=994086 RepID=A0A0C9W0Q2_9AGAM|nr:hypothetical protein HYDPIDRAFT_90751 [Hydnomerulius pinastri MD-312]